MARERNLIVRIDETSVSLTEVLHLNEIVQEEKSEFFQFAAYSEVDLKETLKEKLKNFSLNKSFDNVLVCWSNIHQFLAPMKLFQESSLFSLANLAFGKTDKNELDYNRLPEINRVCIYCIPLWVKTTFVQVFPMASIKAETAIFSRAIAQDTNLKPKMYLRLFSKSASFMILGNTLNTNREIIFSNQYEYENNEDILYLLMNIISNLDQSDQPKEINIFFDNLKNEVDQQSLLNLFKSISDLDTIKINTFNSTELAKIYNRCV